MARDKSSKASSKSKAPQPPAQHGARARPTAESGVDDGRQANSSKTRKSFFGFLRSDKSKSKKITLTVVGQNDGDDRTGTDAPDASSNNNTVVRSSSFSEPGSSKQEQPTRKVKRHLSVSRSGKMKEVRKRASLAEVAQRFENQAQA